MDITVKHPDSGGKMAEAPSSPRCCEDDGMGPSGAGTPVGDRAASVAKAFKVSMNKGEGDSSPSKVSIPCSVNLMTGQVEPNVVSDRY